MSTPILCNNEEITLKLYIFTRKIEGEKIKKEVSCQKGY